MARPCKGCGHAAEDDETFCRSCYEKDLARRMIEIAATIQPAGFASKGDPTDPLSVETEE